MFENLVVCHSKSVQSAMLLSVVGGFIAACIYAFVTWMVQKFRSQLPIRSLLGGLADNEQSCSICFKWLYSRLPNERGRYYSDLPDYNPPNTSGRIAEHHNIPYSVALGDMRAVNDFVNLLGQSGKTDNIEFLSVAEDWAVWDKNVVAIGGSDRTDRIFEFPNLPARWDGRGFAFANTDTVFESNAGRDYGLILKTTHPQTRKKCFVVVGLGVPGTEAASWFLRTQARAIGKVFGKRDFAFLVRTTVADGPQSAEPWWCCPAPRTWRKISYCYLWCWRFREMARRIKDR